MAVPISILTAMTVPGSPRSVLPALFPSKHHRSVDTAVCCYCLLLFSRQGLHYAVLAGVELTETRLPLPWEYLKMSRHIPGSGGVAFDL